MSGVKIDQFFDSSLDPLGNKLVQEKEISRKGDFLGRKITLTQLGSNQDKRIQEISKMPLVGTKSPLSISNKFELMNESDFEIYPMDIEESENFEESSKENNLDFLLGAEKSFEIPKERTESGERHTLDYTIKYLHTFISIHQEESPNLFTEKEPLNLFTEKDPLTISTKTQEESLPVIARAKDMYRTLRFLKEQGVEEIPLHLKKEMTGLNQELDLFLKIKGLKRASDTPLQTSPQDYSHGEIPENLKEQMKNKELILGNKWKIVEGSWLGIEPKFVATKKVTKKDLEKIDQPSHPYQKKVIEFLKQEINGESAELNAAIDNHKILDFIEKNNFNEKVEQFLSNNVEKFKKKHFIKLDYQDPKNLKNPSMQWESINQPGSSYNKIALQYLTNKKITLEQIQKSGGMSAFLNQPANKKLLQEVRNKIIGDLWQVEVPIERARKKFGIKARLYVRSKRQFPRDVNLGAVKESLANEIYTFFGVDGQKLKIIPAQYSNGYPKLLLDSTEIRGPEGQKYSDLLLRTKIEERNVAFNQVLGGRIKENSLRNPEDPQKKHAIKPGLLGSMKALFLFMGDRDKIGSKGENLGYYIGKDGFAHLMNIDPGKAMPDQTKNNETDLMKFNNIESDFSFVNPKKTLKDRIQGGYKNFSIFDDTEYSEKMEGIAKIIDPKNWAKINSVFDRYIEEYGDENSHPELNFKIQIEEMRSRLESRRQDFIDKFKDRVYLLENNRVTNSSKERLNLLDHLEKFSAGPKATFSSYKSKKDGEVILLGYVQVKPGKRVEWIVEKPNPRISGQFIYKLKKPSKDVAKRFTEILKGGDPEIQRFVKEGLIKVEKNGEVSFTVNQDTQEKLSQFFSNSQIAKALGHEIRK